MNHKLGPLKAWQWGAVAVTTVLMYYLYKRYSGGNANTIAPAPSTAPDPNASGNDSSAGAGSSGGADPNLIDPGTGMPLLGEISGGLAEISGGLASLAQQEQDNNSAMLTALAGIQSLGAGVSSVIPPNITIEMPTPTGPANTVPVSMAQAKKAASAGEKAAASAGKAARDAAKEIQRTAPKSVGHHANPGHIVTHHPLGATAASAFARSAEAVGKAVAPPQHQRAPEPPKHFTDKLPLIQGKIAAVAVPHTMIPTPHAAQHVGPQNMGAAIIAPVAPIFTKVKAVTPKPPKHVKR